MLQTFILSGLSSKASFSFFEPQGQAGFQNFRFIRTPFQKASILFESQDGDLKSFILSLGRESVKLAFVFPFQKEGSTHGGVKRKDSFHCCGVSSPLSGQKKKALD